MTTIDPAYLPNWANTPAPDVEDMRALLAATADERVRRPARAWLQAYQLAGELGFSERTALVQAGNAWDLAIDEQRAVAAICAVGVN